MPAAFVYVTAKDYEQALAIGRELVEERLAACINVLGSMTSIYHWQGEIQQDQEAVLIIKTKEKHVAEIIERVKALHTYTCPCVVSWPLTAGNPDYLRWIEEETKE
jgi:periplasmic divalent cation tolerance protein